jgi:hypothetical protein
MQGFIKLIISVLFVAMSLNTKAQDSKLPTQVVKAVTTSIESSKVPLVITESHHKEFPETLNETWYGYPEFSDDSDWYGCDPNLYTCDQPKYYIADFINHKKHYKVIYSITGVKISTHISMSDKIINAIAKTLVKSEYKDWMITNAQEEIFRDTDIDKLIVYKLIATKGNKIHYLFYKADGTLILAKKIKP